MLITRKPATGAAANDEFLTLKCKAMRQSLDHAEREFEMKEELHTVQLKKMKLEEELQAVQVRKMTLECTLLELQIAQYNIVIE